MKKASQAFQLMPVRSAILNIRFIVPRSRTLEFSNALFIVSASEVDERISSPIATVS